MCRHKPSRLITATALFAFLVTGCGETESADETTTQSSSAMSRAPLESDADVDYFFESVRSGLAAASWSVYPSDIEDMLPNQGISIQGGSPINLSSSIIVGEIVQVAAGKAFVVSPDAGSGDSPDGLEVNPKDTPPDWAVVIATVRVESAVGEVGSGDEVDVAVTLVGPDYQRELRGLEKLGKVIIFVDAEGAPLDWKPEALQVAFGGSFLGQVAADGTYTLPGQEFPGSLANEGLETVADIMEEGSGDRPVVKISYDNSGQQEREYVD